VEANEKDRSLLHKKKGRKEGKRKEGRERGARYKSANARLHCLLFLAFFLATKRDGKEKKKKKGEEDETIESTTILLITCRAPNSRLPGEEKREKGRSTCSGREDGAFQDLSPFTQLLELDVTMTERKREKGRRGGRTRNSA